MESVLIHLLYVDENQNSIYALREDLLPFSFGGNKYRIAKKYIEDMKQKKCTIMVGYGGPQSNLSRVLANLCIKNGIKCILISPQEKPVKETSEISFNFRLVEWLNIKVYLCEKQKVSQFIPSLLSSLEAQGERPYYIYAPYNISAAITAYDEVYSLIEQWQDNEKCKFEKIFLACGTGMTLSGLICAHKTSVKIEKPEVIGISIARRKKQELEVIQNYINIYMKSKNKVPFQVDSSILIDQYLCGGYGQYNSKIENILKETFFKTGVLLDPTYTGKAFWGMQEELLKDSTCHKNILFIHTGGTPLFFDYLNLEGEKNRI